LEIKASRDVPQRKAGIPLFAQNKMELSL